MGIQQSGGGKRLLHWFLVLAAPLSPGCSTQPESAETGGDLSKASVLCVLSSGLNSTTRTPMTEALVAAGHPRKFLPAIDLNPNIGSNVVAASDLIAPAVESLDSIAESARRERGIAAGDERVGIVARCMGAFSSRWYAAKIAQHRVRTWVWLAWSNHVSVALKGSSGRGHFEMVSAFASSFRQDQNQIALTGNRSERVDETPWGLRTDRNGSTPVPADSKRNTLYLSVFLDPDPWITLTHSAFVDGAGGMRIGLAIVEIRMHRDGKILFAGNTNHDAMLTNERLITFGTQLLAARNAVGT